MSTSRISILLLMSKWFFIPNMFSLYIFAFQLCLCRKRLTWSKGYLEVIFHALDVSSIIFATSYVEVKYVSAMYIYNLRCKNLPNENQKTIKVIYLLSIEQLILYLAQLNPWLFWYEIILNTDKA